MYYVKTIYAPDHYKLPNISEYKTKDEAATFISTCLKWGIGILMCELIDEAAAKQMLSQGEAEE